MKLLQTPIFARQLKKLHKNQQKDLDNAIMEILENPEIGSLKKGDLNGVRVHKFAMVKQLTLLAYEWQKYEQELILLLYMGSHENFYQNLKK